MAVAEKPTIGGAGTHVTIHDRRFVTWLFEQIVYTVTGIKKKTSVAQVPPGGLDDLNP